MRPRCATFGTCRRRLASVTVDPGRPGSRPKPGGLQRPTACAGTPDGLAAVLALARLAAIDGRADSEHVDDVLVRREQPVAWIQLGDQVGDLRQLEPERRAPQPELGGVDGKHDLVSDAGERLLHL